MPRLTSTGPIHLETYTYRLSDVRIDTSLEGDALDTGKLAATLSYNQPPPAHVRLKVVLKTRDGIVIKETIENVHNFKWTLTSGEVEAWWPVGYGKQPLYSLELSLLDQHDKLLASHTSRVAFRNARVVQEPLVDQPGMTFLFEVNGVRIFCGGSNWIPADSFLTEIKPERYRAWMDLMVGRVDVLC